MSVAVAQRLFGTAGGLLIDRALGEPPASLHPVAAFGRVMHEVEERVYADTRRTGAAYAAAGVALGIAAGRAIGSTAMTVAATSAGRMLRAEARLVQRSLEAGDLDRARAQLPALVGRDPSSLDISGVAAAVVESVAENTVDAVIAPALWAAALGAPGAAVYRGINTMDAMVGHRSERYERFGWASARLDDGASYVPARITAALVSVAAPGRAAGVLRAVRRDAPAHPSPNAGVAEAAFAGALGLELGGPVTYGTRVEHRPRLGRGPRPVPFDIVRAIRLADRVEVLMVALLATAALVIARRRR